MKTLLRTASRAIAAGLAILCFVDHSACNYGARDLGELRLAQRGRLSQRVRVGIGRVSRSAL